MLNEQSQATLDKILKVYDQDSASDIFGLLIDEREHDDNLIKLMGTYIDIALEKKARLPKRYDFRKIFEMYDNLYGG